MTGSAAYERGTTSFSFKPWKNRGHLVISSHGEISVLVAASWYTFMACCCLSLLFCSCSFTKSMRNCVESSWTGFSGLFKVVMVVVVVVVGGGVTTKRLDCSNLVKNRWQNTSWNSETSLSLAAACNNFSCPPGCLGTIRWVLQWLCIRFLVSFVIIKLQVLHCSPWRSWRPGIGLVSGGGMGILAWRGSRTLYWPKMPSASSLAALRGLLALQAVVRLEILLVAKISECWLTRWEGRVCGGIP